MSHRRNPPRPWLILTRDEAIEVLDKLLAVPATTTIRGIPTEVPLGREDGMPSECGRNAWRAVRQYASTRDRCSIFIPRSPLVFE